MSVDTRPTSAKDLAACAADKIEARGLAKHRLVITTRGDGEGPVGAVCLRGAFFECLRGNPSAWALGEPFENLWRECERRLLTACPPSMRSRLEGVGAGVLGDDLAVYLNNHPDTTQEEMVSVLRKVAAG
jgi:hypothetical protein